jgi:hypothetical protein
MGKTSVVKGGCTAGLHNTSAPFAEMTVEARGVFISLRGGNYFISRENIQKISAFPGIYMQGVEIVHLDTAVPKPVIFWPVGEHSIYETFSRFGYPVGSD